MYGDPLILVLVLALGSLSFFAGVVYVFCRMVALIGRSFLRLFGWEVVTGAALRGAGRRTTLVCPRWECRHREIRAARYCSQCGARLSASEDLR